MLTDRRILFTGVFLRSLATGMVGVLLGVHLAKLGFAPSTMGIVIAAGLAGAALAALLVTLGGDQVGRRRTLLGLALLAGAGGAAFALASRPSIACLAAFLGMINGMGRDRGASMILEQAILPATTSDAGRTSAFAWYNVVQDAGGALGGLLAATPALLRHVGGVAEMTSLRLSLGLYAALMLLAAALYPFLSPAVEMAAHRRSATDAPRPRVSPQSRRILWKISSLFALDSLAGGFLTTALLSFFFFKRFGVQEGSLGLLFFLARLANAVSHLAAARLARRFGLVNTMVFTHIPSSLLLVTVAFAPNFSVAAVLFLIRESLVEMDVPTRQSYVMAVVRPEERTLASGVTNVVRVGAWAVGPLFAGLFIQGLSLLTPLLLGSGMKIVYDLLLYAAFKKLRPPQERRVAPGDAGA